MASQACSSDVHLSIKWPERVLYTLNNLITFDTYMYSVSRRCSFKPFLPTCFRDQIHSGIEHDHDLGTTKNHWIRNQEILRLSVFI